MKTTIVILIGLFLVTMPVSAQAQESSQVGTSMANFLKIGVGPKATAMGDAFVALTDDASAAYWNPAGLGNLKRNEALMQTTTWIGASKLYYVSVAFPFEDLGTLGLSVDAFSSGDMQETTLLQPDGTGRMFSANDFAIGASYARNLTDRFSVGVTLKYVNETLFRETAEAVAIDIGSIYTTNFLNNMRLGICMSNLGSTMRLDGPDLMVTHDIAPDVPTNKSVDASLGTQSWDLPLTFRIGIGTYLFDTETASAAVEAAVNDTRDFQPRYNMGSELTLKLPANQRAMLRVGYKANYNEEGLTIGGGLLADVAGFNFKLDYAYADFSKLGGVHRYSISVLF